MIINFKYQIVIIDTNGGSLRKIIKRHEFKVSFYEKCQPSARANFLWLKSGSDIWPKTLKIHKSSHISVCVAAFTTFKQKFIP